MHRVEKGRGQILLCTAGNGWYQEYDTQPRTLHEGDAVVIPANVKHWHGAAKDSWVVHIAVGVPGENTCTEWLEPVNDQEYLNLK